MERMSAEGMFFHRQCFRCTVCKCNLLLGNYAFDDADDDRRSGKFYCKPHFNRMLYEKPNETVKQSEQGKNLVSFFYFFLFYFLFFLFTQKSCI